MESTRLAVGFQALRHAGYSDTVAQRISAPQAPATLDQYQGKWKVFTEYCERQNIDPYQATVPEIAEFLNFLFDSKGLKPATIDGYRVAIAGALKHHRGINIGKDPALSDLSTWMHRACPKGSNQVPPWDLKVVLLALQEPPFEPIQDADKVSLKHLTWKTVFLTLLASGARRGEIHALDYKKVAHDPQWRFVTLSPHQGFVSKTQLRTKGASKLDSITIRSLYEVVGADLPRDRKLCPVRSLKTYMARTQGLRKGKQLLFISYKPGFDKDIHKNTISGWMRKLIKLCYQSVSEETSTLVGTSTHVIRGMAASLAFRGGADIEEILRACHWQSHTTFTDFYLKDISMVQENLNKIGPLAVAQAIIKP